MNRIKAILVDDQEDANTTMTLLLNKYAPEINIIGTYNDSSDALVQIKSQCPDIIFADVEMPGLDGFELKKYLDDSGAIVIYVTGHPSTAIDALRAGAFDFLQKPVNSEQLIKCIGRIKAKIEKQATSSNKEELKADDPFKHKVLINKHDRAVVIDEDDIIFIQAFGAYTTVYYTPGKSIDSSRPIAFYDESLIQEIFYRVHRSYLVNLNHVIEITKKENVGILHLTDGHSIELAKNQLYKLLGHLSGDKKEKLSD